MTPETTAYLVFAFIAAAFAWWIGIQEKYTQYLLMKSLKYKVLTNAGVFVNERLLEKGIYSTQTPTLHSHNFTMAEMRAQAIEYSERIDGYDLPAVLKSLEQCELQTVELSFV